MSRTLSIAVLLAGALLLPSPAHARIVELGQTDQEATPSCPGRPCLAVSRTTGYQAKVGPDRGIFTAPQRGRIVAWSITLSEPTRKQIKFFKGEFGGAASAGVTVLRPGEKLTAKVMANSPIEELTDYFGQTVQFPLDRSLKVRRGDVVALTVPTWAPALAIGFGNDTSWRATRGEDNCDDVRRQTAQTEAGAETEVRCLYRTARLTYTATFISSPRPAQPSR